MRQAASDKSDPIHITAKRDTELHQALCIKEGVFNVLPNTRHSMVRIIALKVCTEKDFPDGYEGNLAVGLSHVEDVLAEHNREIIWPPLPLVNGNKGGTTEIWVRYRAIQSGKCSCRQHSGESEIPERRGYAEPKK